MDIIIQNSSDKPIYQQIVDQISQVIQAEVERLHAAPADKAAAAG